MMCNSMSVSSVISTGFNASHQPLFDNRNANAFTELWFDAINELAKEMNVAYFYRNNKLSIEGAVCDSAFYAYKNPAGSAEPAGYVLLFLLEQISGGSAAVQRNCSIFITQIVAADLQFAAANGDVGRAAGADLQGGSTGNSRAGMQVISLAVGLIRQFLVVIIPEQIGGDVRGDFVVGNGDLNCGNFVALVGQCVVLLVGIFGKSTMLTFFGNCWQC